MVCPLVEGRHLHVLLLLGHVALVALQAHLRLLLHVHWLHVILVDRHGRVVVGEIYLCGIQESHRALGVDGRRTSVRVEVVVLLAWHGRGTGVDGHVLSLVALHALPVEGRGPLLMWHVWLLFVIILLVFIALRLAKIGRR